MAELPEVRRVRWPAACRIVPTRHPSENLFDRVADAADFDALYALEAMSNDRVRDELGVIELVPREQRVYGPGSGPIMAAFTHVNPQGSRFSDGRWGMFYAANDRATAIAETRHHHARFLAATRQGPLHLPMRLYHVKVDAKLHDLRPPGAVPASVYDPDDYGAARALGAPVVELHTGAYCHAALDGTAAERERLLERLRRGAAFGQKLGLEVHAGHGLTYDTVPPIAAMPGIAELNIGHFLIGEAIFDGLAPAIRKMRAIIEQSALAAKAV